MGLRQSAPSLDKTHLTFLTKQLKGSNLYFIHLGTANSCQTVWIAGLLKFSLVAYTIALVIIVYSDSFNFDLIVMPQTRRSNGHTTYFNVLLHRHYF